MTSHQTGTCSVEVIPIQKDGVQEEFPLKSCDLANLAYKESVVEIAAEIN